MPLTGPSFFILGLAVASVTAIGTSTDNIFSGASEEFSSNDNPPTTLMPPITANTTYVTWTDNSSDISYTTSTMNITNSTIMSSTTMQTVSEDGQNRTTEMTLATPESISPPKSTPSNKGPNKKVNNNNNENPPDKPQSKAGIIILVVIIIVALGFGVACYCARKKGRRYSVDFTSRPDEVNIPLSTVEPELQVETVPQNGFQTFAEAAPKESEEPDAKPEVQVEKAETDKTLDPIAESAAPAPLPDSSEDKPKADAMEQSPAAPVELSVEEKADDEDVVSNKTSVETLKETNENNSNNADLSQQRDLKSSNVFWNIPLNCPV